MDRLHRLEALPHRHPGDVEDLASDHARRAGPGGGGEAADQGETDPGLLGGGVGGPGEAAEGLGEQSVPGEDGQGLAVDLVAGGPTPAEVVVVEGREVVVDQAVGVDQLQGPAQVHQGPRGASDPAGLGGGEGEDGPEALAPGEEAVAHGLGQGCRPLEGAVPGVEPAVDGLLALGEPGVEVHQASFASAGSGAPSARSWSIRARSGPRATGLGK